MNAWRYHERKFTREESTLLDRDRLEEEGYIHDQDIGNDGGLSLSLWMKYEDPEEPKWAVLVGTACHGFPVLIDGLGNFMDFIGRYAAGFVAAGLPFDRAQQ
jgi:hypothetical protein